MKRTLTFITALLLASLAAQSAAATLTVNGSGGADFKSINAAVAKASSGDTVLVKSGTYRESVRPKSGVRVIAEAGPVQTRIFVEHGGRGLYFDHVENVVVEGFDVCSVLGVGKPGDGLVCVQACTNVTVRDCYIHDAPNDSDCVKVSDTRRLLLERCCIWNPARRGEKNAFQEGMDTRAKDFEITVRGCWFFQTEKGGDTLIFCKGGCFDILWEDNIFGPSVGQGYANVPVQSGHQNAGERGEEVPTYPSGRFVVRNNLFVGLKGEAAFGFQGPDTSLLYNNVFYRNETKPSLITIADNPGSVGGPALNLFCFNNIFVSNGDHPFYRQRNAPASLANLKCGHNFYDHASGGDVNVKTERGAMIVKDSPFVAPVMPVFKFDNGTAQIRHAREGFQLVSTSKARGAGVDPLSFSGAVHPRGAPEMLHGLSGASKPAAWGMGLHEFSSVGSGKDQ